MNCPKCENSSLTSKEVRAAEVDCCPRCNGIWFDHKELSRVLDLPSAGLRSLSSRKEDEGLNQKRGRCPRDGSELLRVYSPGDRSVVLDTCTKCNGIWLDGGELNKLAR